MDDLSIAFLERWVEENVTPVPANRQAAEAVRLAAACTRDAAEEDITEETLAEIASEESDGDDLVAFMAKALERAELEAEDDRPTTTRKKDLATRRSVSDATQRLQRVWLAQATGMTSTPTCTECSLPPSRMPLIGLTSS